MPFIRYLIRSLIVVARSEYFNFGSAAHSIAWGVIGVRSGQGRLYLAFMLTLACLNLAAGLRQRLFRLRREARRNLWVPGQMCRRCRDFLETANEIENRNFSVYEADPSEDNPICKFCESLKYMEKRVITFFRVDFATDESNTVYRINFDIDERNSLPISSISVMSGSGQESSGAIRRIAFRIMPTPSSSQRPLTWPDPSKVDLQRLKNTLTYCRTYHGPDCKAPKAPVDQLRLFNCRRRAIEHAVFDADYLALSYVWGSSVSGRVPSSTGRDKYARTIEDAIVVTLQLGYTYLWVDQLCIDQGGPHMYSQLRQMDLIYQNADLTIVAVVGENSSHGLPGVSRTSRIPPLNCLYGHTGYFEIKRGAQRIIEESTWNTRA